MTTRSHRSTCRGCRPVDASLLARRLDVGGLALAEVDELCDLDPGRLEVGGRRNPPLVGGEHHSSLARLDRPVVHEPADALGQHHADEVVAGEDERLLGDAGGDDDAVRAELQERVAGRDGDQVLFEQPDCDRGSEQLGTRASARCSAPAVRDAR